MPLPRRCLTSVLLRREGDLFLFDCGEGTQVSLRRLNLRWKKISVVLISHLHADHVTGLPGIMMLSSQVDRDDPLYIIGPPRTREYVDANRRALDMHINYRVVVKEVTQPGIVFRGPGYAIRAHTLSHTRPCYGYCFEEDTRPGVFLPDRALSLGVPKGPLWSQLQHGSSVELSVGGTVDPDQVMGPKRRGRKFCYVTDTVACPGLEDFVWDADLFICEGMFEKELIETAREKRHLTAHEAALIARQGSVQRMGLIHYSPRYTARDLHRLLKEARAVFPSAFLTTELQTIEIAYRE